MTLSEIESAANTAGVKPAWYVRLRLNDEVAIVSFRKKNGDERHALCTCAPRAITMEHGDIVYMLHAHQKRMEGKENNVSFIDLALGEPRCFDIDRLENIEFLGSVNDAHEMSAVYDRFNWYLRDRESTNNIGFDAL